MKRRPVLAGAGAACAFLLAGCTADGPGGPDDGPQEESPTPEGVPVDIVSRADKPDVPVEYGVEMVESLATPERPARVRVSITNTADSTVALGEERAVQFHHVTSADSTLYLHPASEDTYTGPVNPGCWRLTEAVAVPEYYGVIELASGDVRHAESLVYGHQKLPEGECLPAGEHQVETMGVTADDAEAIGDGDKETEFEWGFTLRVGD
ncbi:MAG: hypothetical protein ABEH66_02350 [Halobacteriales archaeon]